MQKILFIAAAILCLILASCSISYDYDFFSRLIVGESIVEKGIIPVKDFLSYIPTHFWYDHEWGCGAIFYLILKYTGPAGIIILQALLMFLCVYFTTKTALLKISSGYVSIIYISFFILILALQNQEPLRCHMFTFVFFALFLFILEKYRKDRTKLIFTLPLITLIWNNLHGGVVAGIGLIFMYFAGELISKKEWKIYFYVLLLSLFVLLINPYGIKYINFLFSATTMQRSWIYEWQPFRAGNNFRFCLPVVIFEAFLFFATILKSLLWKKIDITKIIVLTVTFAKGLLHIKLLSLSLIALCALSYEDLFDLIQKIKNKFDKNEEFKILSNVASKTVEIFVCILIAGFSYTILNQSIDFPKGHYSALPFQEVEFIRINKIKGNIVTPFGLGGYISYKLYPNSLIYMDGRYEEVFFQEQLETLMNYEGALENWREILEKYDSEILMPRISTPIFARLQQEPDWELIFVGSRCGIFVKKEKAQKNYIMPIDSLFYYRKNIFDGYFGKKLKF